MAKLKAQEQALLKQMKAGGFRPAHQVSVEESRAGLTQMALMMAGPKVSVAAVENRLISGPGGELPIRIYRAAPPMPGKKSPVALYFHGGGFYLGNLETHDHVCRFLCKNAGITVIAVDYRLAPENKFPAALEDCYHVLCWATENAETIGIDAGRVALVGDSAGGTLAVAVSLLARDRAGPQIAYQVAVYPALTMDDGEAFPSRRELGNGEYFIAFEDFAFFRNLYLPDPAADVFNPLVSPLYAEDFSGLPPALIVAAEYDPCRDEDARYAELLEAAGVAAEHVCFGGTIHPFFLFDGVLESGREGQRLVAERLRRQLRP
jgi:acetyl esterase